MSLWRLSHPFAFIWLSLMSWTSCQRSTSSKIRIINNKIQTSRGPFICVNLWMSIPETHDMIRYFVSVCFVALIFMMFRLIWVPVWFSMSRYYQTADCTIYIVTKFDHFDTTTVSVNVILNCEQIRVTQVTNWWWVLTLSVTSITRMYYPFSPWRQRPGQWRSHPFLVCLT